MIFHMVQKSGSELSSVLSQSARLTDRRTDRQLSRETALHSLQRSKNASTVYNCVFIFI